MRHAGTLIEVNDGGLGVGAELALGGARGVGSLQRMSAAQMLAAFLAMAAVNFEFADDGLTGDLGLKLLIEMILDDIAATVGTLLGQRSVEGFIDAFRWWRFAMSVLAMLIAFLTARFFGILLGLALGERRGLAFGGTFEFLDSLLKLRNEFAKLLIFEEQLLIGRSVHAGLASDHRVSCTKLSRFPRWMARHR